jgi:hypothetical protein
MKWAGHVAHLRDMRSSYKVLVKRNSEVKIPLLRLMSRFNSSVIMDLKAVGFVDME